MLYELIWVGENTYYVEAPARVGIYDMGNNRVCLIDSGCDKDMAKRLLRILEERGWTLDRILCTHLHADHIGGNRYLQEKTGCRIYASGVDRVFMENTILEPALLYGGCPPRALRNKFLMAESAVVEPLTQEVIPAGLSVQRLDGHSFAMCAVRSDDDGVCFISDALTGEDILHKYGIPFLYDVEAYLESLDMLEVMEAKLFVPAHAPVLEDIHSLIEKNREKVMEIGGLILNFCRAGMDFEGLLSRMFDHYGLTLDLSQYVLAGSTLRSYLSYLLEQDQIRIEFSGNRLFWKSAPR